MYLVMSYTGKVVSPTAVGFITDEEEFRTRTENIAENNDILEARGFSIKDRAERFADFCATNAPGELFFVIEITDTVLKPPPSTFWHEGYWKPAQYKHKF